MSERDCPDEMAVLWAEHKERIKRNRLGSHPDCSDPAHPGCSNCAPDEGKQMTTDTCFDSGCNGCDDCTDYYCGDEYGDEPHGPPEFGCCLPPGECCMPGLHFPSECHTAADYQRRGR